MFTTIIYISVYISVHTYILHTYEIHHIWKTYRHMKYISAYISVHIYILHTYEVHHIWKTYRYIYRYIHIYCIHTKYIIYGKHIGI